MDLGETVGKILIFCNVPQQWHHELGLCVVLFARVEHKFVVGVDVVNFLATTSLILLWQHRGMKRLDRPYTYAYVRQVPPTNMHSLHKVASGCLSLPL